MLTDAVARTDAAVLLRVIQMHMILSPAIHLLGISLSMKLCTQLWKDAKTSAAYDWKQPKPSMVIKLLKKKTVYPQGGELF